MSDPTWREPGHDARCPAQIPRRGWKQILARVWRASAADRLTLVAAGLSFFALLGVFPALAVTVSTYGLVLDPVDIRAQSDSLAVVLPAEVHQMLDEQLESLIGKRRELGLGLLVNLLILMWTASTGTQTLVKAINLAYNEEETRSFLELRFLALLLTFGAILFFVFAVALLAVLPVVLSRLGLDQAGELLVQLLRWPLLAAAVITALSVLYRLAPDRATARWRWATWGSAVAATLWLGGSALFSLYVSHFGTFQKTHGALGAVVVLMLWFFLSALAILFGAEINAEMEHQTLRDSTTGEPQPFGERGARVADTVPDDPIDDPAA